MQHRTKRRRLGETVQTPELLFRRTEVRVVVILPDRTHERTVELTTAFNDGASSAGTSNWTG